MYVVSEITGKRYATVDECVADEAAYKEAQENKKMERLDKAWAEVVAAVEKFNKVAEEISPGTAEELDALLQIIKMA